jgi:hypothetical protein
MSLSTQNPGNGGGNKRLADSCIRTGEKEPWQLSNLPTWLVDTAD